MCVCVSVALSILCLYHNSFDTLRQYSRIGSVYLYPIQFAVLFLPCNRLLFQTKTLWNKLANTKKQNRSCRIDKFMNDRFHKTTFLFNFYLFIYLFDFDFFFANEVICLKVLYRCLFRLFAYCVSCSVWFHIRYFSNVIDVIVCLFTSTSVNSLNDHILLVFFCYWTALYMFLLFRWAPYETV